MDGNVLIIIIFNNNLKLDKEIKHIKILRNMVIKYFGHNYYFGLI